MAHRDLVVIGASAGGVDALQQICAGLPSDLDAAVLMVMHTSAHAGGLLPNILNRAGPLKAISPRDGEKIEKGQIYVAPPNLHMLVEDSRLRLVGGPRENRHRPAIDPTFRSAAFSYGPRVIGIVLTGSGGGDGSSGLMVVRAYGGAVLVQDPKTALFPFMPESALQAVKNARVVPLGEIPGVIQQLIHEPVKEVRMAPVEDDQTRREVRMAELNMAEVESDLHVGKPSVFGCPECGGVLWEIDQEGLLRFRCRVGHAYTAEDLGAEQRFVVETALWAALRALEERASLYRKLAERSREAKLYSLRSFEERAVNAEKNSHVLRDFLVNLNATGSVIEEAPKTAA